MQRNWKEALGFYIIYLILTFVTVFILGVATMAIVMQLGSDGCESQMML
jgi:hypothetical protein